MSVALTNTFVCFACCAVFGSQGPCRDTQCLRCGQSLLRIDSKVQISKKRDFDCRSKMLPQLQVPSQVRGSRFRPKCRDN